MLPTQILVDEEVRKIVAEGENGFFGLLPRHIDFVSALVPGILLYESEEGEEAFIAIDEGILVKYGATVLVSTRNGVRGADLGDLKETVVRQFKTLDEQERKSRSVISKMEADFVRRFLDLK